jgi:hypothetical protein
MATLFVVLGSSTLSLGQGQWDQRYWNTRRKTDVEKIIARLERNANDFRRDLDRWLDYSRIDGTRREDEYNSHVKAFEQATNRLRAEFNRRDKWWETRDQVKGVLDAAKPVADMMRRRRGPSYSRQLQDQWWTLRRQLNNLASTYRLPTIT